MTRLPVTVHGHTLLGGRDNPNCFTLKGSVKIVNMKLGPFNRVVEQLNATDVEVTLLSPNIGLITDSRFPENELRNDRWCTVCCPTSLLPEPQLRDFLRYNKPIFKDGRILAWSWKSGDVVTDAEIDATINRLKEEDHGKA